MFLLKREYFNKTMIIKGLIAALLFSASLYLSNFGMDYKIINTIFALISLYFLLSIPRVALFYTGFFVGLFWFYWISLSFQYYGLSFLIPIVILGIALLSALIFLLIGISNEIKYRALLIFALSFLEPFGFNWLKFELLLINSYFDVTKLSLGLVIIAMVLLAYRKNLLFIGVILAAFFTNTAASIKESELKIALPEYSFEQRYKWNRKNVQAITIKNIEQIEQAILNGDEVVVLPETTFPILLNEHYDLINHLKKLSEQITIITGGLYFENNEYKNSTYIFQEGELQVAHKVVLVPFGEAVPFPEKIKNLINDVFYDGSKDYTKADKPTDFKINDIEFRNAICYEATKDEIYESLDGVKYIIATSNNAWFTPSIEPHLQKRMMQFYAKKYDVIIYHQANGSANAVIKPY